MYEVVIKGILEQYFTKCTFITNKQAAELGISRFQLASLVRKGELIRHKSGVYSEPDELPFEIAFTSLNIEKAVLSLNCALYLQGFSERSPLHFEITVPQGYNASHIKKYLKNVVVTYVKPEVFGLGVVNVRTPTGDYVKCYNLERTICDLIKYPSKVDPDLIYNTLHWYVRGKECNKPLLLEYSEILGVSKKVKEYLRVLCR